MPNLAATLRAKTIAVHAQAAFARGEVGQALVGFNEAYVLTGQPVYLFNAARCLQELAKFAVQAGDFAQADTPAARAEAAFGIVAASTAPPAIRTEAARRQADLRTLRQAIAVRLAPPPPPPVDTGESPRRLPSGAWVDADHNQPPPPPPPLPALPPTVHDTSLLSMVGQGVVAPLLALLAMGGIIFWVHHAKHKAAAS